MPVADVADEDLATLADKKGEKYIPLSQAKGKRGKQVEVVGDVISFGRGRLSFPPLRSGHLQMGAWRSQE